MSTKKKGGLAKALGTVTVKARTRLSVAAYASAAYGRVPEHVKLVLPGMTFSVVPDGEGPAIDDLTTDRTIWASYAEQLGWAAPAEKNAPKGGANKEDK